MNSKISEDKIYDYVIIGSGFGGSVSAHRLTQKGYKVLLIEKGKWYNESDFPKTNWNLRKWLWLPSIKFHGIMKMTFFRHAGILSGVGVGGGSLVYANTLPKPKKAFFYSGSWAGITDWEEELNPHYETAWKMLGAIENPYLEEADNTLAKLAENQGRKEHFSPTKVAVYFGEADKTVEDPFFEGKGPERSGCNRCGACMTGCRYNAKNTLDKNYLWLAQKNGLEIIAEKEVYDIIPSNNSEFNYKIKFKDSTKYFKSKYEVKTKGVVLAGGVLGSVKLLLKLKKTSMPNISPKIGHDIRTNNESLIFNVSTNKNKDFSKGIAIGSIYHPDENTHLEPVRYGSGSGFWRTGLLPSVYAGNIFSRFGQIFKSFVKNPIRHLKALTVRDFGKQTTVLLFMQHIDTKLRFKKGIFRMKTVISEGEKPVAGIPLANDLGKEYAKLSSASSYVYLTEPVLNIPSTAHILGGCVIGKNKNEGVIDEKHKLFSYDNFFVVDGSSISANPGVNPSLTITAMAERAMSFVKEK